MTSRALLALIAGAPLCGCALLFPPGAAGTDPDVAERADGGGEDAGSDDAPADRGLPPADAQELSWTPPCPCTGDELCIDGNCVCAPGTVRGPGTCVPSPASGPSDRTSEEVCARWRVDYPEQSSSPANAETRDTCATPALDPIAHDDALRRLNLYRWLAGLAPVVSDPGRDLLAARVALMLDRNGVLSHTPDPTWLCYEADAADAASKSNIASGNATAARAIDAYVADLGVVGLLHRRWVLYPHLDRVGVGQSGDANALWVWDETIRPAPEFVAYPPPGPVPAAAVLGPWSFSTEVPLDEPQITAVDGGGRPFEVSVEETEPGAGWATLSFQLRPRPQAGDRVLVRVRALGVDTTYETTLQRCRFD